MVGTLVGVLLGGTLAGIFNLAVARSAATNTQRLDLQKYQRDEYFQVLDSILDIRQRFAEFNASWTPYTGQNQSQVSRGEDSVTASHLGAIFEALDLLTVRLYHLRVIGSSQVIESVAPIEDRIHQYFVDVQKELPVVRAKDYRALMNDIDKLLITVIHHVRADLGIEKGLDSKYPQSTPAVS